MAGNLIICFNAVLPLMIYLVIGGLIRKFNILSEKEVKSVNRMIFVVLFPALMFENLYSANIRQAFDLRLEFYGIAFLMIMYGLTSVFVRKIEKSPKTRGDMIQAMYRSNFVIMGLPITINIFGKGKAAATAALIMIIVPLFNVLAVITLEYYRGGKTTVRSLVVRILKNPIILGAIAAIVCLLLGIKIPATVNGVISSMSETCSVMAMIILGASFNPVGVTRGKRNLIITIVVRLLVYPAIGLSAAAALGFRGPAFIALLAMMAAPPAVSSFTMAQVMDSDDELAGNAVIIATPLSCLTLFMWLFIFKTMGMF